MHLFGSIKEMRHIVMAASELKAEGIHFLSPNKVFILASNMRDYIYLQTPLFITSSVYIPRSSYTNIHIYIKATRSAYRNKNSPFYMNPVSNLEVWSKGIRFDDSELLSIEADFISFPIKKAMELKIIDSMQPSFDLEAPFLTIPLEETHNIHAALLNNKSRYLNRASKSEDNIIRIEEQELVLYTTTAGREVISPLNINTFLCNERFPIKEFSFSDKAFYLFKWFSMITPTDELSIMPRKDYCIMEGYQNDMCIKVRTDIRNDHLSKKV